VNLESAALGQPSARAFVDGCGLNDPDNYVSNNIKCVRTYYLYYPTTGDPPTASVLARPLADDAHTTVYDSPSRAGESTDTSLRYRSGEVGIVSSPATAHDYRRDRVTGSPGGETVVEEQGCKDLGSAAKTGAAVVIEYSILYFYG